MGSFERPRVEVQQMGQLQRRRRGVSEAFRPHMRELFQEKVEIRRKIGIAKARQKIYSALFSGGERRVARLNPTTITRFCP